LYISESTAHVSDSMIRSNMDAISGGGLFLHESVVTVTGCTVMNNSAYLLGAGVYVLNVTLNMSNTSVTGNKGGTKGGGIATLGDIQGAVTTKVTIAWCNVTSNSALVGWLVVWLRLPGNALRIRSALRIRHLLRSKHTRSPVVKIQAHEVNSVSESINESSVCT